MWTLMILLQFAIASSFLDNVIVIGEHFEIQIGAKICDGGMIRLIKQWTTKTGKTYSENAVVPIEIILSEFYEINAKYDKNNPHWIEIIKEIGSKSKFRKIWEYVQEIGKEDRRWKLPKQKSNEDQLFDPLFDGHAMVVLRYATAGGQMEGEEAARFHFTRIGLNLFKKENNKDYVVGEDLSEMEIEENPRRGDYERMGFSPSLRTRNLSIEDLKIEGLKVIRKHKYHFYGFNCLSFVYEFVWKIMEKDFKRKQDLKEMDKWPKNLIKLDKTINEIYGDGVTLQFDSLVGKYKNSQI